MNGQFVQGESGALEWEGGEDWWGKKGRLCQMEHFGERADDGWGDENHHDGERQNGERQREMIAGWMPERAKDVK